MFWINSYTIEECTGFFRNKVGPVKAFAALTADQLKFLTGNKFMFTLFVQMSE